MADNIGIIDSSRLKEISHKQDHKKHRHKKYKETKERRHEYDQDVYERYSKKSIPEPVLLTRDIERRKDMQKAKEKQRRRREKQKHGRDPRKYGRYDYDSSSDDGDFKGFGGFGNMGSYSNEPFGRSKRAMMVRRQAAMAASPGRPKPRPRPRG